MKKSQILYTILISFIIKCEGYKIQTNKLDNYNSKSIDNIISDIFNINIDSLHEILSRTKRQSSSLPLFSDIVDTIYYSWFKNPLDAAYFETTGDLARNAGYDVDEHPVITEDGYILTIHRLVSKEQVQNRIKSTYNVTSSTVGTGRSINSNHDTNSYGNNIKNFDLPKSGNETEKNNLRPKQPQSFMEFLYETLSMPLEKKSTQVVESRVLEDTSREVVFLQHGLMGSSDNWNTNIKEYCLAYILSDHGYDVWMGNFRGNVYSRKHQNLSQFDPKFWDFSYDEMAEYDLPAMLKYVYKATGQQNKIKYIGHSMGTAVFFAGMSSDPSLQDIVDKMVAMAPVATVSSIQSPIKYLALIFAQLQDLFFYTDIMNNRLITSLWDQYRICGIPGSNCENLQFLITGFDPNRADKEMIRTILTHNPAGASTRTLLHFAQGVDSGKFQKFNWGENSNLRKYGQINPPEYNVSKIETPIALISAPNDWMIGEKDVRNLETLLPNVIFSHEVENPEFSHLDFLWATDVKALVYDKILEVLKN